MIEVRRAWRCMAGCLLGAALALLSACVMPPPATTPVRRPPATSADQAFEAAGRRYLDEMQALMPVAATALGDHRHDEELDDVSPEGYARQVSLARALISQLQGVDLSRLSRAHQVDIRLLSSELQSQIWRIEQLQEWRWNPLLYTELAGSSIYQLMARDFAPLPDRLRSVGARLSEMPRLLAQARESLDPARVPKIHAETAVKQNPGILAVIEHLVQPQLGALPEQEQESLKAAIAHARTALMQHQLWLEKKLLPEAKGDFRLGEKLYDTELRFALQSPLSRTEIRSRAQSELTRTRQQMYDIARSVLASRNHGQRLPENPTAEEQQRAITVALELAYAQQPQRGEVFDTARQAVEDARTFVRQADLVTVYDDPLDIIPMPLFKRGVALAYCDSPGPLDKGQKTFYAVAPIPEDWNAREVKSYLREYNTRSIYNLTIHEAMPGHYLQLSHANRYDAPLRAVLASGTFIEGWAVYTERMMVEQGFRGNDPLMRLIQLKWYLRTIGNALLDQAVHVDGISKADAMRLMIHDTFQEEREADAKWTRAQLTSAQLPTYFVGLQEHLALRDEAKRRWGEGFTLKRYHDAVLSYGSPPVRYVRELIFELPIE
jgi:uncharacterized protein (DUF885 family)